MRLKLKKIIDVAMTKYTHLNAYNNVGSGLNNYIEQCIYEKLSDLRTPNHPTYALMIRRAIEQLNEEKGSTEEAISKFIKEDVEDLPLAHASFLSHHLNKLSESGEIVKAFGNRYMVPVESTNSLLNREEGNVHRTEDRVEAIEEQKPAEEQSEQDPQVNGTEDLTQVAELVEVLEEQIEQVQQLEVIEKHNEAKEHKVEFIEEKYQEQRGDSIEKPYPSQKQQNKEQDEVSSQQGQTQRHEIAVIVEEPSGAEEKNKVTGEQIQEKRVDGTILDPCLTKKQQIEVLKDQNLPHDHQIEDVKKQIQLQEQILLIEKLIELQGEKNEVIEKQINPPTEVRSKIIGLSDLQFYKKPEKDEAIVTTQSSSLTSQRLKNDGSLLPVKDKCVELLKRTKKIEEKLMDIISSSCTGEVSKHDTLKPSIEEQEKKNLKKPEQTQQKKQVKLCGQHEARGCHPEPTGASSGVLKNSGELDDEQQQEHENSEIGLELGLKEMETKNIGQEASISKNSLNMDSRQLEMKQLDFAEGRPELCSNLKLLESLPVMSSLEVPSESRALELEKKPELPYSESALQLKSSRVEPSAQKEQQQKTTLCGKAKAHEYQLKCQGQGRQVHPPRSQGVSQLELSEKDTIMESFSSKNQYEQLQQFKRKGRGRTSKLKPDWHMAIAESLPSDDQRHHEQPLPKHRGWGRPPKSKEDIDPPIAHQNLNGHQKEGCESQGRHPIPTPKRKADTILQESIPLDHQNHNELQLQQPGKRSRGRPPRPKPVLVTTMEALLPSQQQEQPQRRGQGRPPKRKLFTDRMMGEPLTSESQLQQPKPRGRGRPPKVDQQ
ncbi:uncharacterized protein LOC132192135 isoform X2 [Corylus avellana]|uniref:uncharacterized protein LOC132162662 isoform X2 n=1 Tax=Corylus avellana TaxID=13451 RepID=UPI00286BC3DA|nr:uncharacterized protein LOC132162662 isoform X2 [Corylus avellana]XP_059463358.1 uncharacterized protein LOC132192135 isoform X2 [Corylus avellana]